MLALCSLMAVHIDERVILVSLQTNVIALVSSFGLVFKSCLDGLASI